MTADTEFSAEPNLLKTLVSGQHFRSTQINQS
jgi:hypothetical protein